jgi:prepilin-type N-terminal cleavage/methylation domain-containing protein
MRGNQNGLTLVELLTVMAIATLVLAVSVAFSVDWMTQQTMKSALYDIESHLEMTRVEAVNRNHECRFVIDTSDSTMQVLDGNGTDATGDDLLLYEARLPSSVVFADPEGGDPVSLDVIVDGSIYEASFGADGALSSNTGDVSLYGGEMFGRVSIFAAGGTQLESWNGSAWEVDY